MKRKKIIKLIIWGIGLVCIIGIANFIITSGTVERNSADYEKAKIKNWNAVMAKSSNKKVINLQVDNKKIESKDYTLYMSDNMNLMIPINIIMDVFDCSQNIYNNKRVIVEKGRNIAVMYIGKDTIIFNDNQYKLQDKVVRKNGTVYIPANIFKDYFNYKYTWDSQLNKAFMNDRAVKDSKLPERYSYIDKKRAVEVKDQGNYGTCWAFATLTALETSLMPEEKLDFSENNLVYNNYLGNDIQDGGDYMMAMSYLMAWKGPVLEKDDKYGNETYNKNAKVVKHVQEAQIIPEKDYNQIKEMVYKYGGVETSMYMSMSNADMSSVYYNETEHAYCYKGNNKPNHDVVIIGWDDNYSKELFNDKSIKGDGAFICMNSWGADFGYKGTFYVSYYDDLIGKNNVCYTKVEDTDNYKSIYQSDLCGWTGTMGFQNEPTVYFSNVFKAKADDKIKSVGFYGTDTNLKYEVFVCTDYKNNASLNERSHVAASGKLTNKGFYTIELDKEYAVKKNQKFAIIIKVTNNNNDNVFKLIPVEMQTKSMEGKVDLTDGEGYFSSSGVNWQSAENQGCNICLKAYGAN